MSGNNSSAASRCGFGRPCSPLFLRGILATILYCGLLSSSQALDNSITVELSGQVFTESGEIPGRYDSDTAVSIEPDLEHDFNNGNTLVRFMPFGRWDSRDPERRHTDIRELNVIHVMGDVELLAGISKMFWGVTESAHLVDIINQTDYLEDFDGEDKLGQPMLRLSKSFDQSTLSGFILPGFRERAFLSPDNPLALPFVVNDDDPIYQSDRGDDHVDFALRYAGYAGIFDYGISFFSGTSRDPAFTPGPDGELVPYYPQINQFGLDLQVTDDAWLWKLESVHREFDDDPSALADLTDNYTAVAGGLEYSFYGLADGAYDLGLLAEYLYDSRDDRTDVAFQNDLFLATRFGFTDVAGTEILAGGFVDLDDSSLSFRLEASRRVFTDAKINLEAQAFSSVDPENQFYSFKNSDFVLLSLELYF